MSADWQSKAEGDLRANRARLEFLLRVNDALRPLSDPGDVQETLRAFSANISA
jgi:hypothetical protein